jgi:GT2 family glycosyltransferase
MSKTLPIIVINWNGLSDTIECIESILNSDYQDIKIFIVDNNSDNDEGELLKEKYKENHLIEVVLQETNIGFGAAHNDIINNHLKSLSYEYICLINNDAIIERDCLNSALKFADKESVDILSMKMIDYSNRQIMDSAGHNIISTGEILPIGSRSHIDEYNHTFSNIGASGGACVYSKKCLDKIGVFDPFFFVGYEDAEYGLRAKLTRHNCMFCPDAIVYHKGGQSIKKIFSSEYSVQTFRHIRYTNYKLLPWPILILTLPFKLIRLSMIMLVSILLIRWSLTSVVVKSLIQFYIKDFLLSLNARKAFRKDRNMMNTIETMRLMKSTILNDIAKFYSIFVRKAPTAAEKYR